MLRATELLFIVSGALTCVACGTLPNGRGVGQDATLWPGAERVKQAAYAAAIETRTWAPALGAVIAGTTRIDDTVAEFVRKNSPVYGSQFEANRASGTLRSVTIIAAYASLLAAPGAGEPAEAALAKTNMLGVHLTANLATVGTTSLLKTVSNRMRPDKSDDRSFPSGHASSAFMHASFAHQNIALLNVNDTAKTVLQVGVDLAAIGTGWARIEAGVHYPSDVLAAAALGNFFAKFFYNAFMGLDSAATIYITPGATARESLFGFQVAF